MIISEVTSLSVRILPSVRGTESIPNEPTSRSFPYIWGPPDPEHPLRRGVCEDLIDTTLFVD